jgi:glycolate oxidase
MTLPQNVYQALEDIVGAENISADPAVLDSYRYSLAHTAIHIGPYFDTHTPRGAAVLLPGSTEEVQAIVKLCNRYKITPSNWTCGVWTASSRSMKGTCSR